MTDEAPPVRRPRLAAEERRAQILDAAREVFLHSGADGARVQEIADAAGVNAALLYQHFDSKEELFEEAVAAPLAAAFESALSQPAPVVDFDDSGTVMRAVTRDYIVKLLAAMDEIGGLLGVVLFSDAERGKQYFQQRLEPLLGRLQEVVRVNQPAWNHVDFDPELILTMVFGMVWYAAVEDRFRSGPSRDPERVAHQITSLVFDGLLKT